MTLQIGSYCRPAARASGAIFALMAIASSVTSSGPAMAQDCMRYNAGPQAVEGKVSVLEARDAAGRRETALILTPKAPVCLDAKRADDRVSASTSVHIFSTSQSTHRQLQAAVGKSIQVTGAPMPAHTSHHHAPIIMNVSKVKVR